jgi:hypothetical protein
VIEGATTVAAKRRQWSREFTPRGERTVHINISNVPPTLRTKFAAKCKRLKKSQRNLVLGWIRNWVEDRRPDEQRPGETQAEAQLDDESAA